MAKSTNTKFHETPTSKAVDNMFPKCRTCVHYKSLLTCAAFDVIPDDIILNEVEHNKVRKDQKGDFVYVKVPEA